MSLEVAQQIDSVTRENISIIIRNLKQKIAWNKKTLTKHASKDKLIALAQFEIELEQLMKQRSEMPLPKPAIHIKTELRIQKTEEAIDKDMNNDYFIPYTVINGRIVIKPEDLEPEE